MRLFIAIQFNDEILEALNELQEDLRDQGMEGNYSPSENLHLTLAFIGECGDPEEVMDALEESDFRPLTLHSLTSYSMASSQTSLFNRRSVKPKDSAILLYL